MQRVFTKDVPGREGKPFRKKGDVADWPYETWAGIARAVDARAKDMRKVLDSFSRPVADLATAMK